MLFSLWRLLRDLHNKFRFLKKIENIAKKLISLYNNFLRRFKMKTVKFKKEKGSTYVGYVGTYPEAEADRLVKSGVAEFYKVEKPSTPVKPSKTIKEN